MNTIELAREAGFNREDHHAIRAMLIRFAHLVRAASLAEPQELEDLTLTQIAAKHTQEPVAWMYRTGGETRFSETLNAPGMHQTESVPLYTAPQPRREVELTDEDILRALMLSPPEPSLGPHLKGEAVVGDVQRAVIAIARAVIAAYKEKNT